MRFTRFCRRLATGLITSAAIALGTIGSFAPVAFSPIPFTISGTNPAPLQVPVNGAGFCAITFASGSNFGGGTLTLKTGDGVTYTPTTAYPDLGSSTGGTQTISSAPTKLQFAVSGSYFFELVATGMTSGNVTGTYSCTASAAQLMGGGSASGTVSCPTCPTPAPIQTMAPIVTPSPEPSSTPFPYFLPTKAIPEFYNGSWVQVSTSNPLPAQQYVLYSSGALGAIKAADTPFTSAAITASVTTTTQLLAAGGPIVIAEAKTISQAAQTSVAAQLVISTVAGCTSSVVNLNPVGVAVASSSNGASELIGSTPNAATGAITPAAQNVYIPAGYYLCVISTGSSQNFKVSLQYGQ